MGATIKTSRNDGKEDADRRDDRTPEAGDEIADERRRDDDGSAG